MIFILCIINEFISSRTSQKKLKWEDIVFDEYNEKDCRQQYSSIIKKVQ